MELRKGVNCLSKIIEIKLLRTSNLISDSFSSIIIAIGGKKYHRFQKDDEYFRSEISLHTWIINLLNYFC